MHRQWMAVAVLIVGLAGFLLMEAAHNTEVFSPQLASRPLQGRVIGVDAGHGGYDGGCEGASGVPEKEFNLAVAQLLQQELQGMGATVVMSRTEDVALIDPEKTTGYKKRKELDNRLEIFREGGVEAMVSIHMNKYSSGSQRGAQVFYMQGGEAEGRELALCVQSALYELDPEHCRTASAGDYYILNACGASALVECGFLSNEQEEQLLLTEEYRQKIAQAVARGVAEYFRQSAVQ